MLTKISRMLTYKHIVCWRNLSGAEVCHYTGLWGCGKHTSFSGWIFMRVSLYKVNLYTYMYVKCTYVSLKYEIGKILSGIFSVIILSLCWLTQRIVFCSSYHFCSRQVLILQLNKKKKTVCDCFHLFLKGSVADICYRKLISYR